MCMQMRICMFICMCICIHICIHIHIQASIFIYDIFNVCNSTVFPIVDIYLIIINSYGSVQNLIDSFRLF